MEKDTPRSDQSLTVARAPAAASGAIGVPAIVADAGEHATRRFLEFFAASIRNRNTRAASLYAAGHFFAWCERHRIGQLPDIEQLHIAAYIEKLQASFEKSTVKRHLAAVRMLFDWLVTGHVVTVNPATSVLGPKHVVKRGRTLVLSADLARALVESIDASTVVGLRDRALIGGMTYAFARIGAVVAMRVEDYFASGKRWWVQLQSGCEGEGIQAWRPSPIRCKRQSCYWSR
jgi:integrase/recombinase XerD